MYRASLCRLQMASIVADGGQEEISALRTDIERKKKILEAT